MNYSCIIQYQNLKRGEIKNRQKVNFKLVNEDKKKVVDKNRVPRKTN